MDDWSVQDHAEGMRSSSGDEFGPVYPVSLAMLPHDVLEQISAAYDAGLSAGDFPELLKTRAGSPGVPGFMPDLARLEFELFRTSSAGPVMQGERSVYDLNPTLQVLTFAWKGLTARLFSGNGVVPQEGEELVLVWKDPKDQSVRAKAAAAEDLLALKIVVEGLAADEAARAGGVPVSTVEDIIIGASERGIILGPQSLVRRDLQVFGPASPAYEPYLSSSSFTLQWHVTQSCDLHCKHCYDRSDRSEMRLKDGMALLDDFRAFCRERRVKGHVSFSGGNPLLYPHFTELYRAAEERGFESAILGNPAPRETIEELVSVRTPSFYQVSLEGLQQHNDDIRGRGHFDRVIAFLDLLRESGVYSMVMLTLTKDNIDQVIPLAEFLRDKTDTFNFNRLSMVGEGSNLRLPDKRRYIAFLEDYLRAAETNPVMGLKDNLFNILRHSRKADLFGGCTGYGCGAGFNFISILPDGEAHACRKFPSPIGNVVKQGIAGVYDSDMAARYRSGCASCKACPVRPVCGGCLAVAYGHGLDVFSEKDPYCFIDEFGK